MRKPKMQCFRSRKLNQIYVERAPFQPDIIMRLLESVSAQRLVTFFETTADLRPAASRLKEWGVMIQAAEAAPVTEALCEISLADLLPVMACIREYQAEDFCAAAVQPAPDLQNPAVYREYLASIGRLAEKGLADFSVFVNIPEDEWIISAGNSLDDLRGLKEIVVRAFDTAF